MSRRAREREFRVVDESGNSEHRWVRSRMSERAWLNIFSGLFVGYGAWFRSAEDRLEGNIGVGILGFMIPWAVDVALGGTHEFPHRLDFSPWSAVRREPGAQKQVGPVSHIAAFCGEMCSRRAVVEGEPRAALRRRPGRSRWHRRRGGGASAVESEPERRRHRRQLNGDPAVGAPAPAPASVLAPGSSRPTAPIP